MKKLFIIANWKANKTEDEMQIWLSEIKNLLGQNPDYGTGNKEIVVCPPFTHLAMIKKYVKTNNLPIRMGSQDISVFGRGAYTGEIPAALQHDFADFCIVGHSERRKNFNETDEIVAKKVEMAKAGGFLPIVCVQGEETPVPKDSVIVAYEPISAIGTGNPDTPESADKVASIIKEKSGAQYVIYGGSVTGENVNTFTQMPSIDGVLVGGASLDAEKFMQIIKNS
ncbi:MAG TPA: triose-phosphate isomerase family protein [Xanthomonadales bacterium]|nr:triose-phosphate isomerase family protein [Xanthomonadales bacterium]